MLQINAKFIRILFLFVSEKNKVFWCKWFDEHLFWDHTDTTVSCSILL